MADTVRRIMESMLPELDALEEQGLFSKTELRSIVARREAFEYALQRRAARRLDYERYAAYEESLEALRSARARLFKRGDRSRHQHGKREKRGQGTEKEKERERLLRLRTERCFVRRAHTVYRRATRTFRGDLGLWSRWLSFCRRSKSGKQAQRALGRALALHPTCAALWVAAASWEFERGLDAASARALMQHGLRSCGGADLEKLWVEYFRMELLYARRLAARREILGIDGSAEAESEAEGGKVVPASTPEAVRAILRGAVAKVVYSSAVQAVPGSVEFAGRFLDVLRAQDIQDGRELQAFILEDIGKRFPDSLKTWALGAEAARSEATSVAQGALAALDVLERGLDVLRTPQAALACLFEAQDALEASRSRAAAEGSDPASEAALAAELVRRAGELAGRAAADPALRSEEAVLARAQLLMLEGESDEALQILRSFTAPRDSSLRQCPALWRLRLRLEVLAASAEDLRMEPQGASDSSSDSDAGAAKAIASFPGPRSAVVDAVAALPQDPEIWLLCLELGATLDAQPARSSLLVELSSRLARQLLGRARGPVSGGLGAAAAACWRALLAGRGLSAARAFCRRVQKGPCPGGDWARAVIASEMALLTGEAGCKDALADVLVAGLFESFLGALGAQDEQLWLLFLAWQRSRPAGPQTAYQRALAALADPRAFVEACAGETA